MRFTLWILIFVFSLVAHAGPPVIFKGRYAKVIAANGIELKDTKYIVSLTANPSSGGGFTAAIGSIGLWEDTGHGRVWLKTGVADTAWTELEEGDLDGPASATDNAITRFDGTTGKLVQDSTNLTAADTGEITSQSLTAGRALVSGASKEIQSSAVTATELGYVSGVTSAIQTQLDSKVTNPMTTNGDLITQAAGVPARIAIGGANTVLGSNGSAASWVSVTDAFIDAAAAIQFSKMENLTANRALASDASGDVSVSAVTDTELGYVSGVTSAIQTQLDAKVDEVASTDNALPRFNGAGGSLQNSVVILDDSSNMTGAATIGVGSGTASVPGLNFTGDPNNGLYYIGADQWGLSGGGSLGLEVRKATGAYGNVGIGGSASTSDLYPMLIQRDQANAINIQFSNPSTNAAAGAKYQLAADAGNNVGELSLWANSAVDAYGKRLVMRSTSSSTGLSFVADGVSPQDHKFYSGGVASTDETIRFNADHSLQFMQDLASTPSSPAAGTQKVFLADTGNIKSVNSQGDTSLLDYNPHDYFQYYQAQDASKLSTYDDGGAAGTAPTDGTGGTVDYLTATVDNTGQMYGDYSFKLAKSGNDAHGEGLALASINFDGLAGSGQVLWISFNYQTSANYAADDLKIYTYQPSSGSNATALDTFQGSSMASGLPVCKAPKICPYTGWVDPHATADRVDLLFHVNSANTSAWDVFLDGIKFSRGPPAQTLIGSDWESWTPTGSWTTNVTYTGKMRRVGDSLEAQVKVLLSGAPNSTELTINLPNALTIDSDKVLAAVNPGEHAIFGDGFGWDYSASPVSNRQKKLTVSSYWYSSTGFDRVKIYYQDGGATAGTVSVDQTSPITWASNDVVSVTFKVPIKGWSATALISTTENYTKGAYVNAYNTNNQLVTQNIPTPLTGWTEVEDSHNAFDPTTGIFTAPRDGRFAASFTYLFGATITTRTLNYINHYQSDGSTIIRRYVGFAAVANTESGTPQTACVKMNKGEKLKFEALHSEASARNIHASGDLNHLTVVEVLDKREWGTFGEDDPKSIYSSTFTPGGTNRWHGLTGNSIILPQGIWLLNGGCSFNAIGPAVYTAAILRWASANGLNSAVAPALATLLAGFNDSSLASNPTDYHTLEAPTVRYYSDGVSPIYLVPYSAETTPANARISTSIYAQRLV